MTAGHLYKIASVRYAFGVAIDHSGNVVIATFDNERVKVLAASTGTFYGQAMTAGHLYTIAGIGTAGYNGDGIPATSAELTRPRGLAIDAAGNVVLADTQTFRVRVIAAASGTFYGQAMTAGDIYTIAGSSGTRYGMALRAGDIYTIAGNGKDGYSGDGGPGTAAELANPGWPTTDGAGNVIIADQGNNRIRVVAAASGTFYGQAMTAGDIYTIAATAPGATRVMAARRPPPSSISPME
jgi:trimeric autotransporter adhesin